MVTKNKKVSAGFANGMWVELKDVILSDDAQVVWDNENSVHYAQSIGVRGIVVAPLLLNSLKTKILNIGLPAGQFVVPLDNFAATIKIGSGKLKLHVQAFPLVQAHCITGHKIQGQTLKRVLVSHFNTDANGKKMSLAPGWLYVALSRVCRLSSLYLHGEVELRHGRPRVDMTYEFARLAVIEEQTKIRVSVKTAELDASLESAERRRDVAFKRLTEHVEDSKARLKRKKDRTPKKSNKKTRN
jgi:hypothetical protein